MGDNDKLKKKRRIIYICGVAVLLIGLLIYGYVRSQQQQASVLKLNEGTESSESSGEIKVHVAGAVKTPGLVILKNGDRVADAINAAGGLTEDADTDEINLAAKVEDGQKITVRSLSETTANSSGKTSSGLININTADKETLMTLSGIGEVIAGNIIDYRESKGLFSSIEEIKSVNRIGDKLFEQIKDHITI